MPTRTEAWEKEIAIEDECGELKAIKLTGVKYTFEDGKQEIVRALRDRWVLINPIKDYSNAYKDIVIAVPFEHLTGREFTRNALLYTQFDEDLLEFVEREYHRIGARIMMNIGKHASEVHVHKQIIQVCGTQTIIPGMVKN